MNKLIVAFIFTVSGSLSALEGVQYSTEKGLNSQSLHIFVHEDIKRKDAKVCPTSMVTTVIAAEECEKKKFKFFDIELIDDSKSFAWCFATDERFSLGVVFAENSESLIVESLEGKGKSSTKLKAKDKILTVAGIKVSSNGEVKNAISTLPMKKTSLVKIKIERDGKTETIQEPIILKKKLNTAVADALVNRTTCRDNTP